MANIEQRKTQDGKIRYRVLVRLRGQPPQSATFERRTDAKQWAQQTEAAIREGRHFRYIEAKRHTLAELIERYSRDVLPTKPKSRAKQAAQLDWWSEQLGAYVLADCSPQVIGEARDKLLRENIGTEEQPRRRAPATAVRYMAALSHAFAVAVKEWGWIEDNPLRKVTKPKEPRGRVRFLDDGERTALLDACRKSAHPYLYPVVVLALSTGMRHGEIMRLTWRDVDFERQRITLEETKNDERRAVPLAGEALRVLQGLSKVRRIDTPLLFPSSKPWTPAGFRRAWLRAIGDANVRDFRFHDLRHSAASYLAMNGASLVEIAAVLGHKTLQMTKRYTHLAEGHTHKIVEKMNERIFG